MTILRLLSVSLILAAPFACGAPDRVQEQGAESVPAAGVVDSVFPMEVMLSRFREGIPETRTLRGGVEDRDSLVARVVRALDAQDTLAFEAVGIDLGAFAWLYYPTAVSAQPPYELPPGVAWFQMQEENRKGVFRALRELGGRRIEYVGHRCAQEPAVEGDNRIWTQCRVTLRVDGGEPASVRLFSSILEREGRFVVLSYANDF
jgi:hypothetical protein